MKTIRKNWTTLAGAFTLAGSVVIAVYACVSAWGQTLPGLSIKVTPTNQVALTVINGTNTGKYQIYFTEFLESSNSDWTLLTNGTTGQTNFSADMGDLEQAFFKAVNNTNFVPPVITVIIQSPANGSTVQ